jgi:flagellin
VKNQLLSESNHSAGVFTQYLENIPILRTHNGASMFRLTYTLSNIAESKTNIESKNDRIIDVDIAHESTQVAKYDVLVQASAQMLAHTNATNKFARSKSSDRDKTNYPFLSSHLEEFC